MEPATLLLLAVLGGGESDATLQTIDTPGFSVVVPRGEIKKAGDQVVSGTLTLSLADDSAIADLVKDYDKDKLFIRRSRILQVQWDAYSIELEEDRRLVIDSVVRALPMKDARRLKAIKLDDSRELHLVGSEDQPFGIALVPCGPNVGVTITIGFTRELGDLRAAARKVTDSVKCKPGAAHVRRLEAAVQLPVDFGRSSNREVQMYMSTAGEVLVLAFVPGNMQNSNVLFDSAMKAVMSTVLGMKDKSVTFAIESEDPFPGRQARMVRILDGGDLDGAFVATIYCPKLDNTLLGLWFATDGTREQALERLARVACPGEPSAPVRTMSDLFGESCKAGNLIACEILKEMPQ